MSPRPKRSRKMIHPPGFRGFHPFGCPEPKEEPVRLLLEEYEAVKLADYQDLNHAEAAQIMDVSRPTFSRIYDSARKKIAQAFMEVRSIQIEGGNVESGDDWYHCTDCHTIFRLARSSSQTEACPVCRSEKVEQINTPELPETAKLKSMDTAPGEVNCICPKCGFRQPHVPGQPCRSRYCPHCDVSLIRENSPHHRQLIKKLKNKSNQK